MYRRETKEKAAYAGNRTRRTDSVKQHEMAALREMEQWCWHRKTAREQPDWKRLWRIWKAFCSRSERPVS